MAASSNLKRNYHVFLSFRGPDVSNNFLSHLYTALDQKGIHTFVDREELRKGDEISPTLMKAIEESRVAIIVFSENYASSPWCLEEVAKIMECKKKSGLLVFPVFYKVEPREVRGGGQSYGRAMAEHESKFGKDSEKVKRWKKALLDAGSLSGWDLNDRDEAELIQSIVKELSILLDRTPLHVAKYPVGIDSQVQNLISLSQIESADNDVLMIGLWGPGGVGKTTIAKALYNAIERQFKGCSFLARVRETSNQRDGLVALQKQLLSKILSHKKLTVYSVDEGISLIRERLCCKKVLLVLDDVDHLDQLNALAGEGDWFGKGSTIIVTSRDKHLLTSCGINFVYEVQTLGCDEALDLFGRHAFPDSKKVEIRRDLIDGALHYAGGLPLALEVLGSFLRGRKEPAWESTLLKLSKIPEPTINRILKISFDGLEDNEREIFLDIACFFKGKAIDYIRQILHSCDFHTTIGIEILIERSLIKDEFGTLQMHDLIQLMGKDIVNRECPYNPEKRSRLWLFEDVLEILQEDKGTNAIKAIVLDLPTPEIITICPNAFKNMKMLRLLVLRKDHISSQGPVRLPSKLGWIEWADAPELEFGSGAKKLVTLDVRRSHIKQLGGNFQNFIKLKSINFTECKSLVSVHDLSSAPNLESLKLDGCQNLVEVHQSIGYLDKLRFLSLILCSNLSIFPNILKTKSLQTLNLAGCSKLEKFPDIPEKMEYLIELSLEGTAIKQLPTSIENLVSVQRMNLSNCKNLARLPSSIYKLKNLECLHLHGCLNFAMFPKNVEDSTDVDGDLGFSNLSWLNLDGCNLSEVEFLESSSNFPELSFLDLSNNKFTHLPTSINKYDHLKCLQVKKCKQLQEIPQLPSNILKLDATNCISLQNLPDLSSLSKSSSVEFSSYCELFCNGINIADASSLKYFPKMGRCKIVLVGREMPEWFLPCKEGSTFFMFPPDLCNDFLGLAFCLVVGPKKERVVGPKKERVVGASCVVRIFANGQLMLSYIREFSSLESDHMHLAYFGRNSRSEKAYLSEGEYLSEVDYLLPNHWNHFQICFEASKPSLKKCGFRLICDQKEDDEGCGLTPVFEEGDSDGDDPTDTEEYDSPSETDAEEGSSPLTKKMRWSLTMARLWIPLAPTMI